MSAQIINHKCFWSFGKTALLRGFNTPLGVFTHVGSLWPTVSLLQMLGSQISRSLSPDDSDRPPVANGGQDRVVQPQDAVMLNGIASKDDNKILSYQWQMLTAYPYAVIEVRRRMEPVLPAPLSGKSRDLHQQSWGFCLSLCRKQTLRTRSWCQI